MVVGPSSFSSSGKTRIKSGVSVISTPPSKSSMVGLVNLGKISKEESQDGTLSNGATMGHGGLWFLKKSVNPSAKGDDVGCWIGK